MDRHRGLFLRLIGETPDPLRRIARPPSPLLPLPSPLSPKGGWAGRTDHCPLKKDSAVAFSSCIFGRAQGHRPYTYRSPLNWLSLSCTPLVPFVASPLASPVSPLTKGGLGGVELEQLDAGQSGAVIMRRLDE